MDRRRDPRRSACRRCCRCRTPTRCICWRRAAPSLAYLLGTDVFGRDICPGFCITAPVIRWRSGYWRRCWERWSAVFARDAGRLLRRPPLGSDRRGDGYPACVSATRVCARGRRLCRRQPGQSHSGARIADDARRRRVARAVTLAQRERDFVTAARWVQATRRSAAEILPNPIPVAVGIFWYWSRSLMSPRASRLPRVTSALAGADLGQHDRGGAGLSGYSSPHRVHSLARDVPYHFCIQYCRRQAARRRRSEGGGMTTAAPLLEIHDLTVTLPTERGLLRAVDGVTLSLTAGRTLGIVGRSGSGKTMLAKAILDCCRGRPRPSGRIVFDGRDPAVLRAGDAPSDVARARGGDWRSMTSRSVIPFSRSARRSWRCARHLGLARASSHDPSNC